MLYNLYITCVFSGSKVVKHFNRTAKKSLVQHSASYLVLICH